MASQSKISGSVSNGDICNVIAHIWNRLYPIFIQKAPCHNPGSLSETPYLIVIVHLWLISCLYLENVTDQWTLVCFIWILFYYQSFFFNQFYYQSHKPIWVSFHWHHICHSPQATFFIFWLGGGILVGGLKVLIKSHEIWELLNQSLRFIVKGNP